MSVACARDAPRLSTVRRGAAGWPERLEHLADPPARIWLSGPEVPAHPAVAVVGARRASEAGLRIAHSIGAALAARGVQVVSGMALGIDAQAHRGALAAGGSTVAVLGCGADVCYPPRNHALHAELAARGGLLSEEPPGTEPAPWRFPKRNRLIAALAVAVIVVEAGERSGSLITARHALDLGRDVLAVPGPIHAAGYVGSNLLVRDGAQPYLGPSDLDELPALAAAAAAARLLAATPHPGETASEPARPAPNDRSPAALPPGLDPLALRLLEVAGGGPVHPDVLAERLHIDARRVARLLTALELCGRARTRPGGLVEALPERPGGAMWV